MHIPGKGRIVFHARGWNGPPPEGPRGPHRRPLCFRCGLPGRRLAFGPQWTCDNCLVYFTEPTSASGEAREAPETGPGG